MLTAKILESSATSYCFVSLFLVEVTRKDPTLYGWFMCYEWVSDDKVILNLLCS